MTSGFVPLSHSLGRRVRAGNGQDLRLARWVLAACVLLELAVQFFPQALLASPIQQSVLFKQVSGYAMAGLLVFAMAFGWLRRLSSLSMHHQKLNGFHQCAGLLLLLLLASHMGARPSGFLLYGFHCIAIGMGAGALRALLGNRLGPRVGTVLLFVHIGLACLVSVGALAHLYFVYSYTG